jgi:rod shape-determining protein MreC
MMLALATPYLSEDLQQGIAFTLQASALQPFIATQQRLTEARANADQIDYLQFELDALSAVVSTQSALADENRTLRNLLGLAARAGPAFLPTTVLRPGTPGSESMFLVDVGYDEGVREGAPVVSGSGLVGVIRDVRGRSSVGMDWTHPDFRVSAMLVDGTTFGIVENVRGTFREQDRLMLNGTAYHEDVREGMLVITSGLGLVPRGVPIGTIESTAEVQGTWRKSYWLRPAVEPGSVTHVLVETVDAPEDLTPLWAADSTETTLPDSLGEAPRNPAGTAGSTSPPRQTPRSGATTGESPRSSGEPPAVVPSVDTLRGTTSGAVGATVPPAGVTGVDTVGGAIADSTRRQGRVPGPGAAVDSAGAASRDSAGGPAPDSTPAAPRDTIVAPRDTIVAPPDTIVAPRDTIAPSDTAATGPGVSRPGPGR